MARDLFEWEHEQFRAAFKQFIEREILPHYDRWEQEGIVDRGLWQAAGHGGFIAMAVPPEYGGPGITDFRFNVIVTEEIARAGVAPVAFPLLNDVTLAYFLGLTDEDQKRRWLPGITKGELITAIAMTEPSTGSDVAGIRTTARRDGDHYIVSGSKTFITNGQNADLVIVAAKTDPDAGSKGVSLLVLERDMPGFKRGRNLQKIGQHAQDTSELFFDEVRVPLANRLGAEGSGFYSLMHNLAQERLSIAVTSVAVTETVLEQTIHYVRERRAFGQPIGAFQNTRFLIAELHTETTIARVFVDQCIKSHLVKELAPETAAMAKWWTSELLVRVIDRCLQLHGGYGYMLEYPIARAYVDWRPQTIYGGSTEIMKEIIGRSLRLDKTV